MCNDNFFQENGLDIPSKTLDKMIEKSYLYIFGEKSNSFGSNIKKSS